MALMALRRFLVIGLLIFKFKVRLGMVFDLKGMEMIAGTGPRLGE
jgi:hypothetical protein